MKKTVTVITALALVLVPATAQAKTYHIVKDNKVVGVTKIAPYGYTYHRLSTVKCPFAGCRRAFSH
jgi:hypothetical protein